MKWMENLSELAMNCKNGTYVCDIAENLAQTKVEYYIDQYLYYREELSVDEANTIKKQIITVGETIIQTYPSIQPIIDEFKANQR